MSSGLFFYPALRIPSSYFSFQWLFLFLLLFFSIFISSSFTSHLHFFIWLSSPLLFPFITLCQPFTHLHFSSTVTFYLMAFKLAHRSLGTLITKTLMKALCQRCVLCVCGDACIRACMYVRVYRSTLFRRWTCATWNGASLRTTFHFSNASAAHIAGYVQSCSALHCLWTSTDVLQDVMSYHHIHYYFNYYWLILFLSLIQIL